MPTNKYVCIHGHFYQPPRESAWIEIIELQDSAAPFHDWNERINFECYAPNAAARILNGEGHIKRIINNYGHISFNFGPTLLSWMEEADPATYRSIQEADAESVQRFGGHGSAMAQAYNHLIMPLANERDKRTQVLWGIADFEHRFGRRPEGMWMPETAVDTATLEVLADAGIAFTVLAPRQARAFRPLGTGSWTPVSDNIDTTRPYLCKLPSGKQVALFFYDGNTAKDVAFQGLLNNGQRFAERMLGSFDGTGRPELAHIATDGESYGHHHQWGEMALAYCLDSIGRSGKARVTNYGEYLSLFPPEHEVMIHENSSWSCVHGVERWRSDCGCHTGGQPGWNQAWRGPLRASLDWLRDTMLPFYEKEAGGMVADVWAARNDYISVILDRSEANVERFLARHTLRPLGQQERIRLLRLLEMQRHAMLMYTSCAWFFSEVSGIETNQVMQYALRATYHYYNTSGNSLLSSFLQRLEAIPSNVYRNAGDSFREHVLPSQMTLTGVGMHYAASCIFNDYEETDSFLHYKVVNEVFERIPAGFQRLAIGRTTVVSNLTQSEKYFSFAVLYLGQQNMIGSISLEMSRTRFDQLHGELVDSFRNVNLGDVINLLQGFGPEKFSFKHLFKDEKRKIYQQILERSFPPVESVIRDYYEDNYQLMSGMAKSDIPVPEGWKGITQFVINRQLHQYFEAPRLLVRELQFIVSEFTRWNVYITDMQRLKLQAGERIFHELKQMDWTESDPRHLQNLIGVMESLNLLGVHPELWKSQNLYYKVLTELQSAGWVGKDTEWKQAFTRLGALLRVMGS